MRQITTVYYMQRRPDGRVEVFVDGSDGRGPIRLRPIAENETRLPDWGPKADPVRCALLARLVLTDFLGDKVWARQLCEDFSELCLRHMDPSNFQLSGRSIQQMVTAIETGVVYGSLRR